MTLELIPSTELVFKGPFNVVSTTTLKLSNTANEKLAYKIKTTAPKRYCVKPNSGFLDGHSQTNVHVMLQPQPAGQPDDRTRHKFMVQWAAVPSGYTDDVENFWKQDVKSLNMQDAKLKCVFNEEPSAAVVPDDSQKNVPRNPASDSTDNRTSVNLNSRSSPLTSRVTNSFRTVDQDRAQDTGDDSTRIRLKQEIDRLKAENDSLTERLQQSDNGLRQRPQTGNVYANLAKSSSPSSQQNGLVLFGFRLTEQLILVAFILALLFGFSLGYFLFSCSN